MTRADQGENLSRAAERDKTINKTMSGRLPAEFQENIPFLSIQISSLQPSFIPYAADFEDCY